MPIRPELRCLYPANWRDISMRVRFKRAGGRCQNCKRPHGQEIKCLPDGRWFDPASGTWRSAQGRPARWPDLIEAIGTRSWTVRLAAAHLDNQPWNSSLRNLRALCQRCHLAHDRPYHLARRRITYRRRWAIGDLFDGMYA
jgi:5-methylcytosine-specific restriction endonuclease McrA